MLPKYIEQRRSRSRVEEKFKVQVAKKYDLSEKVEQVQEVFNHVKRRNYYKEKDRKI